MPKMISDPNHAAAAIWRGTGWCFPKGTTARAKAGSATDLQAAARHRREGRKSKARDALAFARDARLFAPGAPIP